MRPRRLRDIAAHHDPFRPGTDDVGAVVLGIDRRQSRGPVDLLRPVGVERNCERIRRRLDNAEPTAGNVSVRAAVFAISKTRFM